MNPAASHDAEVIRRLRGWTVSLPLAARLRHAGTDVAALTSVLVEVELSDGIRGHAEVRANGAYATREDEAVIVPALRALRPEGKTVCEIDDELAARSRLARMALDVATWDALARRVELPLYQMWNSAAAHVDSVRTHAQIGFGDSDTAAESARSFVAAGFDRLKIRVGGPDMATDIGRVHTIRQAVGPAIELIVDANGAWTYDTAAAAIDALADIGVTWVEQPVMAIEDMARLRRHAAVPIYADESARDSESVERLAAAGAADGVHLKLEKCGTARLLFQTAAAARANGLKIALGQMDQGQLGCAVTTHLAVALELDRAELWGWASIARDVTDAMEMHHGCVAVPVGPGNGIEFIDTSFAQEIL
jgi:L-alanine-DL-glutamate epimerase-like enolase superfamily enzyme